MLRPFQAAVSVDATIFSHAKGCALSDGDRVHGTEPGSDEQ